MTIPGRAILIVRIISPFGCSGSGGGGSERCAISTVGDLAVVLSDLLTIENLLTRAQQLRVPPESVPAGGRIRDAYDMNALALGRLGVARAGGGDFFIGCPVEVFHIPARDEILLIVTNDSSIALVPGG